MVLHAISRRLGVGLVAWAIQMFRPLRPQGRVLRPLLRRRVGDSGRYITRGVQVSMVPLLLALMLSLGSSGPEQNDLRLTIERIQTADAKPSNPEFAITFENRGSGDFVALLGFVFAGRLYPNAITLLLTEQSGRTSTLQYRIPTAIQGRVDPYTVGLPRRATYVLRVSLAQYRSPYTGEDSLTLIPRTPRELDPQLPRGDYTLKASLQGLPAADTHGSQLTNLWKGATTSNVLRFSIP